MPVQENSIQAYESVKLPKARQAVLDAITSLQQATDREIADHLGWPINRVTGRRGELVKAGFIEKVGNKTSASGRPTAIWTTC